MTPYQNHLHRYHILITVFLEKENTAIVAGFSSYKKQDIPQGISCFL